MSSSATFHPFRGAGNRAEAVRTTTVHYDQCGQTIAGKFSVLIITASDLASRHGDPIDLCGDCCDRFADLVWKPVVLIEMKNRWEDLTRHCRQAFDY
jgi:hypothetical protein